MDLFRTGKHYLPDGKPETQETTTGAGQPNVLNTDRKQKLDVSLELDNSRNWTTQRKKQHHGTDDTRK
jgi:hypothetical protein